MLKWPWLDQVGHFVKYAAIYLIYPGVFLAAGIGKVFDPVPEYVKKEFDPTWVSTFPGVEPVWKLAGVGEIVICVLMLISLVTLEWLPGRSRKVMRLSLTVAMFLFAVLATGQNLGGEYSGAAELFAYFGATVIVWILVSRDERLADGAYKLRQDDHPAVGSVDHR